MITTAKVTQELTKENILKFISEEDIFRKYIPYDFKLGESFSSPLRLKDSNPNFNVYYNKYLNRVEYKDYAYTRGTAFTFVMELFRLTFHQTLVKIVQDFNLPLGKTKTTVAINIQPSTVVVEPSIKERISYVANTRPFTKLELEYWLQFGITKELLEQYNIYACSTIIKNGQLAFISSESQPIFVYFFPTTGNMKIYRPLSSSSTKWRGNVEGLNDIQGFDQLPDKGELLIITKSLKDVLTLKVLGFTAIAPHSESQPFPEEFIQILKNRFSVIISLYDRDRAGMLASLKLWRTYKIFGKFIPKKYQKPLKSKDPSDLYKNYGYEKSLNIINSLIYEPN